MAIEVKCSDGTTNIAINPGPNAKVEAGTQGFFIAQSDEEAKRYGRERFQLTDMSHTKMACNVGEINVALIPACDSSVR